MLYAQQDSAFEKAIVSTNKMIAVVIVLVVILVGIAIFLFYLERKIKQLENQINNNKF